jgi:hypothetical protein
MLLLLCNLGTTIVVAVVVVVDDGDVCDEADDDDADDVTGCGNDDEGFFTSPTLLLRGGIVAESASQLKLKLSPLILLLSLPSSPWVCAACTLDSSSHSRILLLVGKELCLLPPVSAKIELDTNADDGADDIGSICAGMRS